MFKPNTDSVYSLTVTKYR